MKKAVVIVGPTAVGKTSFAIKLAKKINGALLSADSVQVYKSLDIISGKDKNEFDGMDVKLIDIVTPQESFSVAQFQKLALKIINSLDSHMTPIIVGGTGLYVKSLIDGVETSEVKPDLKLRNKLEKLSLEDLQTKLKGLDKKVWEEMNESDRGNKRRLIRKIEILLTAKPKTSNLPASPSQTRLSQSEAGASLGGKSLIINHKSLITNVSELEFLQIGLELPREILKKRIDIRVEERLKMGAIEEAKDLFQTYEKLTQQVKDANGYKQLFEYLKGKDTFEKAIEKWKISEYRHAKNQMTWFKKDERILWFDAQDLDHLESVEKEVDSFLASSI